MTGDRRELELIKAGLKDRIADLCQRLLPDGAREGRLWVAHNPRTGDAIDHPKNPALKIALDRDVGAWTCWRSGDKGDVIGLIGHCQGCDFKAALDFARDFLGLKAMTPQRRADFTQEIERNRAKAAAATEKKAADRRKAVARLWESAAPESAFAGNAAEILARRYFEIGRGIPNDLLRHPDRETFRFLPALEWWKGARWETHNGVRRKVAKGPEFPAIVAAIRSATGQVMAVHCTFLDPVKPQKAPVDQPKLMFGDALGAVIRISHGPEGLPPEQSREPHPLIIGEGTEDGKTLAIGAPEARVWAGGSLAGMAAAPVWLDCVSAVFVAADNDWKNRQAMAQFDRALAQLESHGKPVAVMRSAIGKDFNDGMTP